MTTLEGRQAPGTPVWIEHAAADPTASKAFYRDVVGWQIDDSGPEFGHYGMASVDGRMAAGLGSAQPGMPAAWTLYLESDDLSGTAARGVELGGATLVPATGVPTVGEFAVLRDPTGATIGLWRSDPFTGFGAVAEVGFAGWHELVTTDLAAAQAFYTELFGWTVQPMEGSDGSYLTVHLTPGADPVAGMTALPDDAPITTSYWHTYVQVPDADKAADLVREGGGTLLQEPFDTPNGRMVLARDPEGAPFSLFAD
ncbi:MAG: VOC family protein [Kineosporiaceae bacterium]